MNEEEKKDECELGNVRSRRKLTAKARNMPSHRTCKQHVGSTVDSLAPFPDNMVKTKIQLIVCQHL
jgi:hypothetical protein